MKIKTEKHFDKKYTYDSSIVSEAFDSEDGQEGMLETYKPDIDQVLKLANSEKNKKRVWTMIDGDNGMYLIAGYHLCNRIYYVITNEEWKNKNEEYLIDEYAEEET